jgi:hypothetical protein
VSGTVDADAKPGLVDIREVDIRETAFARPLRRY